MQLWDCFECLKLQNICLEVTIIVLPLDVIRKYYPDLPDEDLKKIQVFVYELCCRLMQHFYGEDWAEDIEDLNLENKEG